ncbi:Collagen alpha-1(XXV) chain [Platysternon megacephalum]|uniref:Collagen alpha-1(XXV) chain n=1 Tax=Platysternon megacephalum TaxID=55544 RepID=A0A4D9DU25_9SAUR|nr:Collagen alpha-1(XXV) chain [Platysternon megacephalum]
MLGKSQEAKRQDGNGEPSCLGGQRCCPSWTLPSSSLLAAFLSVVAVASCVYLGVKTSDLHARVSAIESAQGDFSAAAASYQLLPGFSLDQLNSMMQEKVERLLAQKSYEHLAKIRIAREAPPECNCPAGKQEQL